MNSVQDDVGEPETISFGSCPCCGGSAKNVMGLSGNPVWQAVSVSWFPEDREGFAVVHLPEADRKHNTAIVAGIVEFLDGDGLSQPVLVLYGDEKIETMLEGDLKRLGLCRAIPEVVAKKRGDSEDEP